MYFRCLQFFQKTNLKIQIFALAYMGRNVSFVFWKNWKKKCPFKIKWPLGSIWNANGRAPPELMLCYLCYFDFFNWHTKGQIISKGNFGVFNSSKKRTESFCPSSLGQKFEFSSLFFGRIEGTKKTFRN